MGYGPPGYLPGQILPTYLEFYGLWAMGILDLPGSVVPFFLHTIGPPAPIKPYHYGPYGAASLAKNSKMASPA